MAGADLPVYRLLLGGALMIRQALLLLVAIGLTACDSAATAATPPPPAAGDAHGTAVIEATGPAEPVQDAVAAAVGPAVVALQESVQTIASIASIQPATPAISPAAVALIVRWEVTSESLYSRRYESPLWPGGASGVTWGIGYDGGHQTRQRIGQDWSAHEAAARLQATSGITGAAAKPLAGQLSDVRVPFAMASGVFEQASLPQYRASARRSFGAERFDGIPADAQGGLVSLVYNRGAGMAGPARSEMRAIRDECLPGGDLPCIAAQIRSMCRLWRGTFLEAGLCARREDEARLVEGAR